MDDKITKLKNEIKKLKTYKYDKPIHSYRLIHQKNEDNKMYSALLFDNDYDNCMSNKALKPFVHLRPKLKYVINYSITLDILKTGTFQCFFFLGTKDGKKFKIIKGSKTCCNSSQVINKQIILNNTLLYETDSKTEIFLICSIDESRISVNSDKSILKYSSI